jgi:hypothetical protein
MILCFVFLCALYLELRPYIETLSFCYMWHYWEMVFLSYTTHVQFLKLIRNSAYTCNFATLILKSPRYVIFYENSCLVWLPAQQKMKEQNYLPHWLTHKYKHRGLSFHTYGMCNNITMSMIHINHMWVRQYLQGRCLCTSIFVQYPSNHVNSYSTTQCAWK